MFQLFIAEVTLFFHKKDLDIAIVLSLTIMLVMYTMYQSISQVLPATAYLKFIDVWLIFCLLVPFVVFIIQVFMKMEKPSKESNRQIKSGKWIETNQQKISGKGCIKRFALFMVPFSTVLFVCCYILVAVYFYSNP
jgi:hypothetical protein